MKIIRFMHLIFLFSIVAMPTLITPLQLPQVAKSNATKTMVLVGTAISVATLAYLYNQCQEIGKSAGEFELNWPKGEPQAVDVPKSCPPPTPDFLTAIDTFKKKFDFKQLSIEYRIEKINRINHVAIIANIDSKKIGEAIAANEVATEKAYLNRLKVDDEWQHKGIGQHLFKIIMKELCNYGICKVGFDVIPIDCSTNSPDFEDANTRLRNFYKKLGTQLVEGGFYSSWGGCTGSIDPRMYKDYTV